MVKPIETRIKSEAHAIIVKQLMGFLLFSSVFFVFFEQRIGLAVLAGGMAYSLPDLLFVQRFIRYTGTKAITGFMSRFFAGKMVKLILRSILVVLAAKQLPSSELWIILGFVSCTFFFWAACMMHFSTQRGAV